MEIKNKKIKIKKKLRENFCRIIFLTFNSCIIKGIVLSYLIKSHIMFEFNEIMNELIHRVKNYKINI